MNSEEISDAVETPAEAAATEAPAEENQVEETQETAAEADETETPVEDPTSPAAIRKRLKGLPGRWYVLHTYAGYEKRVKQNLEIRTKSMNMEEYIFQVEVPMEEVFEVKRGERKLVTRVRMPGYALVRMNMDNEAWRTVQETQGVTGFVGNGRDPVALTEQIISERSLKQI